MRHVCADCAVYVRCRGICDDFKVQLGNLTDWSSYKVSNQLAVGDYTEFWIWYNERGWLVVKVLQERCKFRWNFSLYNSGNIIESICRILKLGKRLQSKSTTISIRSTKKRGLERGGICTLKWHLVQKRDFQRSFYDFSGLCLLPWRWHIQLRFLQEWRPWPPSQWQSTDWGKSTWWD